MDRAIGERAGVAIDLSQVLYSANVQLLRLSELDQFVAACDVAAIERPIGNMPGAVFEAMQPDGNPLFMQVSQDVMEFWRR